METYQPSYQRPALPIRRDASIRTPREARSNTTESSVRTSVARPDEYSFVEPPKPNKIANKILPVKYNTETRSKKGHKNFLSKSLRWLKLGLVVVIMARLFFSQGGVMEYIERAKKIDELNLYRQSLIDDNHDIINEIKQIETDVNLQKQLMREHLGLIGPDEYMIVFRSETVPSAK